MCGILGIINHRTDEALAKRCLDEIAHRGPDGQGLWQDNGVTLGHRRLSILDLSDKGSQPMAYADRYMLVFNGEIYNFIEIRNELRSMGYRFYSETDSEVLLASYDAWGEKCVNRFNGMWAFLIWDKKTRTLFISRDRFGVKPLYYVNLPDKTGTTSSKGLSNPLSHGVFAFASEMKALSPLINEIDRDAIKPNYGILKDTRRITYYESTDECVISCIKRFPAGCNGFLTDEGLKIKQYWNTLDNIMDVPDSYDEQVEMMRELFLDACRIRMRSDVTIGTALSGGLDSSATICAMAQLSKNSTDRMSRDWQHAYVAAFPGTTMDESAYAKKVTGFLNINSTFVEINPLNAIDKFDDFIYKFEDVYLTSPIPMMLLYGALKADNTVVTIDGHGADELFGGYTFDFIHALSDCKSRAERDMVLNAYIDSFPDDNSNISLKNKSKRSIYLKYIKRNIVNAVKSSTTADYMKVRAKGNKAYDSMDSLNKILYASSHETILPTLLRNYDRYSMANSVEIRMPFMDYRIVSFAFSIGFKSKLNGGYSKSIIRDAMAPFMPHDIAYRKTKIGFNTPIVEWMRGPLKDYFLDKINEPGFKACEYINHEKTRAQVLHVINDDNASFIDGEQAFSSIYPYLWQQAFYKKISSL